MNRPATDASEVPQAVVRPQAPLSLVWLIPIVAAIAGLGIYTTFAERGPTTPHFQAASGIEPGKPRSATGTSSWASPQSVHLTDDLTHVLVTARIDEDAASHLREGPSSDRERPDHRCRVSGLGHLLSGPTSSCAPSGAPTYAFTALDSAGLSCRCPGPSA